MAQAVCPGVGHGGEVVGKAAVGVVEDDPDGACAAAGELVEPGGEVMHGVGLVFLTAKLGGASGGRKCVWSMATVFAEKEILLTFAAWPSPRSFLRFK